MPKRSFNPKDIISLLTKLKEQTPEYPAELLEARKAALLKHAATLNIQGKGQGGEGGSEVVGHREDGDRQAIPRQRGDRDDFIRR